MSRVSVSIKVNHPEDISVCQFAKYILSVYRVIFKTVTFKKKSGI